MICGLFLTKHLAFVTKIKKTLCMMFVKTVHSFPTFWRNLSSAIIRLSSLDLPFMEGNVANFTNNVFPLSIFSESSRFSSSCSDSMKDLSKET